MKGTGNNVDPGIGPELMLIGVTAGSNHSKAAASGRKIYAKALISVIIPAGVLLAQKVGSSVAVGVTCD